jgi:hypothetical protein
VPHERRPEPGQPLDLGGLVVGEQIEVHLVPGRHRGASQLQRQAGAVTAQHPEIIAGRS